MSARMTPEEKQADAYRAMYKLFGNDTPEHRARAEAYARYYLEESAQLERDYSWRGMFSFLFWPAAIAGAIALCLVLCLT